MWAAVIITLYKGGYGTTVNTGGSSDSCNNQIVHSYPFFSHSDSTPNMEHGPSLGSDGCFICGDRRPNSYETHHVVPKRYGGSDDPENLVSLCSSCHSAIERLYDDGFYARLGLYRGERQVDAPTSKGTKLDAHQSLDRKIPGGSEHIIFARKLWCSDSEEDYIWQETRATDTEFKKGKRIGCKECGETFIAIPHGEGQEELCSDCAPPVTVSKEDTQSNDTDELLEGLGGSGEDFVHLGDAMDGMGSTPIPNPRTIYYDPERFDEDEFDTKAELYEQLQIEMGVHLHCAYCPIVFRPFEHAKAARHLRLEHFIQDPYTNTEYVRRRERVDRIMHR